MRLKLELYEGEYCTLHNEEEENYGYFHRGFETEDFGIDLKLSTLIKLMDDGKIKVLSDWLKTHAEVYLRAEIQKRDEKEMAREERDRIRRSEERKLPKPKKQCHGHVYILKADNGLYKIGKAKNLTQRVTDLGIKIPMKIELIHSFETDDYTSDELNLHEKYKDKRDTGEWFALDENDIREIMEMCEVANG